MKQRKTFISLLFGMCALATAASTLANDKIKIYHIVNSNQEGLINLTFTINNASAINYTDVSLVTDVNHYLTISGEVLSIGNLLANNNASTELVTTTDYDVEHFQSGLPLLFRLKGINSLGELVEIPVYSFGGEQ